MAERSSLTSQLQRALVEAERRKPSQPHHGHHSRAPGPGRSQFSTSTSTTTTRVASEDASARFAAALALPSGLPATPPLGVVDAGHGYGYGYDPSCVSYNNSPGGGGWDTPGVVWHLAGGGTSSVVPVVAPSSFQQPPLPQQQPGRSSSTADLLEEMLLFDDDIHMLDNVLAYQVIHNEFAEMIGDVSARLESWAPPSGAVHGPATPLVMPGGGELLHGQAGDVVEQDDDVESWMESIWSCNSAAAAAPPPPPGSGSSTGGANVGGQAELETGTSGATADGAGAGPGEEDNKTLDEVTEMLLECGEAVVRDDVGAALRLLAKVRDYSTPDGTHLQRLAHYFAEALMASLNGTGADLCAAAASKRDRPGLQDAERAYMTLDPTSVIAHHFAKSVLLEAFAGAERVHIVDYGILGHQWHSLLQALAHRVEGPPRLRITGIELPQPGLRPDAMVNRTGRRLAQVAATLGVPFEFKAIASNWEDVQVAQLGLRDDEVLAVASVFRLRHLLDDSVVLSNPRRTVLERIASMRPAVFIMGDRSLAGNAPFLMTRLREALPNWYSFFDFLECALPRDSAVRRAVEQEHYGYKILNMIACEGRHRRERPEAYHQWHRRLLNAGFVPLPLTDNVLSNAHEVLKDFSAGWNIGRDQEWLLTGWKGRVNHALSAWTPSAA